MITFHYIEVNETHRIEVSDATGKHYPQYFTGNMYNDWAYYKSSTGSNKQIAFKSERGARKFISKVKEI